MVSCPTEFVRGIIPSKVGIQLTQLTGNCVLHQHVVHYNYISCQKEDKICWNTWLDMFKRQNFNCLLILLKCPLNPNHNFIPAHVWSLPSFILRLLPAVKLAFCGYLKITWRTVTRELTRDFLFQPNKCSDKTLLKILFWPNNWSD